MQEIEAYEHYIDHQVPKYDLTTFSQFLIDDLFDILDDLLSLSF